MKFFWLGLFTIIISLTLSLFIKGDVSENGGLAFQRSYSTKLMGPFEGSNTSSRFALVEAIIENKSFNLNEAQARFASPDVVEYQGKFLSIFTPGISLFALPFYILGSYFNTPQLFTFFTTLMFAIINVFLITKLAQKLGANLTQSLISGIAFLFGSNALAYALTLTQHHGSTMIILLALLNALNKRTFLNNLIFGFLLGIGLLIDIPNFFLLLPIGIYILVKHFEIEKNEHSTKVRFNPLALAVITGLIPLILFFGYYNYHTTGKSTLIGQNIGRTDYFAIKDSQTNTGPQTKEIAQVEVDDDENSSIPLDTRKLLRGFYVLLVSDERSIFYYSPIVLIGLLGMFVVYKSKQNLSLIQLSAAIIGLDLLIYSMFSDHWGGWSFGPRYLIPAIALLCIFIGPALKKFHKNIFFNIAFIILLIYSVFLNNLGALTTNSIPPKDEALALSEPIPYNPTYNFQLADANRSSSLVYNIYLKGLFTVREYLYHTTSLILLIFLCLYLISFKESLKKHE